MTTKRNPQRDVAQARFSGYAKPLVREALERAAHLEGGAEDFHKLRVALRRLRTLLWAYRPLLDEDFDARERAFLKRMATAAGDARNWDIAALLLDELDKRAEEGDGQQRPGERLQGARDEAREAAQAALEAGDLGHALRDMLRRVNRALNTSHSRRVPLRRFARKRVETAHRSLRKRMRRAEKVGKRDYTAWHDVRKGAKKLRYLLEFFGPELPRRQNKRVKPLKKIQQRFGALNDVVASEQLLADHREVLGDKDSADAALAALGKERKRRLRAAAKSL